MKPGDKVWITRYIDIIEDKCTECGGIGYKTVRDDWYGGYDSRKCDKCDELGLARYKLKSPGWFVDSKKKEIIEIKITKFGTYLVFNRDLYGSTPSKNIFNPIVEDIPDRDVFKNKKEAEKYCKENNKK